MKTTGELALAVHARAAALKQGRERAGLIFAGGVSTVLGAVLIPLIGVSGGLRHGVRVVDEAGTALLVESAGGYVLTAVIAFMVGVIVTTACVRRKKRR